MRKILHLPLSMAYILLTLVCVIAKTHAENLVNEPDGHKINKVVDPAGVSLHDYGVSEQPCNENSHLATIVTAEHVYTAFCDNHGASVSVVTMAPNNATIEPFSGDPLAYYLAISPEHLPVPSAIEQVSGQASSRPLTHKTVKFVHPTAEQNHALRMLSSDFSAAATCQSANTFINNQCGEIDDWVQGFDISTKWCRSSLLSGNAQRTGSGQGVPGPFSGKIRVTACDDDVVVRRYYKNSFNNNWWNAGNATVKPGHTYVRIIHHTNAKWCESDFFGPICQYASDLRFRVEPTAGGRYRYTGGFGGYFPVP